MHEDCEAGRIGCVECKTRLADFLNERLAPVRKRRAQLEQNPAEVNGILAQGAEKAREVARETMEEERRAMDFD